MGRKAFVKDLENAATVGRSAKIANVRAGADDGTINFVFMSAALPTGAVVIEALVPGSCTFAFTPLKVAVNTLTEVSEYPSDHMYFLYTTGSSEHVPRIVSSALESIQSSLSGRNLLQMLDQVSLTLESSLTRGQAHDPIDLDEDMEDQPDEDHVDDEEDELLSEDDEDEDEHLWSPKSPQHDTTSLHRTNGPSVTRVTVTKKARMRIRSDLRAAKRAGFKVGVLGDLNAGGFVCLSIRVVKLGISEEAMQAWGLRRKHYFLLMIRFEQGYRTLEQVSEESATTGKNKTEMRVALSERYKPSITDAINAFTQVPKAAIKPLAGLTPPYTSAESSLEPLFIGRPLNDLLRERFAGIAKYRLACGFSWTGSETFFNDIQGKSLQSIDAADKRYNIADDTGSRALPPIVTADHISDSISGLNLSFPLVAMQFVLRHFVRCTEFCLVCHCRIEASFEALKPYVCSKPLCLYQYMALGFGPSIEWEITAQPDVVDLLVSFCYAGAKGWRLREFPVGIDLRVPGLLQTQQTDIANYQNPQFTANLAKLDTPESTPKSAKDLPSAPFVTSLDTEKMELVFSDLKGSCPVKVGEWVAIECKMLNGQIHTRVEETILWPVVRLQKNGIYPSAASQAPTTSTPATTPKLTQKGLVEAKVYVYNQNFDELSDVQKQQSIVTLLETLPAIYEMKKYLLQKQQGREPTLKNWRDRLSESTLNLLRWIIASNRSCIVQVDKASLPVAQTTLESQSETLAVSDSFAAVAGTEDRVSGMANWMQFRFAQGAPDKEQRFIDCVNEVAARTGRTHPTLFAWHGSPLANWHSIVRQGLNYKETLHGRAYGDGVYMSPHCSTSMSYSNMYSGGYGQYNSSGTSTWPNSRLRISCALSLNEVVNAPDEFTSKSPHYVVDKIDWIQTRYLFLKVDAGVRGNSDSSDSKPLRIYEQDHRVQALGENGQPVVIPITAVSKSRRPAVSPATLSKTSSKKMKSLKITNQEIAEQEEDDAASIITNEEDNDFLQSSDEDEPMLFRQESVPVPSRTKRLEPETSMTDFVSGSLDISKLKMLKPPSDASSATTRTLLKALTQTLKVQRETPPHELGWYVHGDRIENVYQWIVEMHSFEATLPLAKDMKQAGLTSIVLELRFTNQFPFSPPFVRVITPRFTPFLAGGGGHVTAGGALCMELLTNNGWLLSTSIENVLLQVRMAMSSMDPRPARLQPSAGYGGQAYGIGEAIDAYKRACLQHGWTPAKDFDSLREASQFGD
jgi:ubiquitin-conjugating enzyme E2 Q